MSCFHGQVSFVMAFLYGFYRLIGSNSQVTKFVLAVG